MAGFELAQLNVARMKAPMDSALMAGFVARLEDINALADAAPGFVWRLQDESGDATAHRPFGDDMLVNLSVWRDVESLQAYVYRSAHAEVMSRRKQWFERVEQAWFVLWWVPAGHRPDEVEAAAKLAHLREHGPTAEAFTFKRAWPVPASAPSPVDARQSR